MLLAINVGNSRIFSGIFDDNGQIKLKFKIFTDKNKTADEYCSIFRSIMGQHGAEGDKIDAAIISSVVPQLTNTVFDTVVELTGVIPMVVGPGVKTGFPIKIDSPAELGGDMVANTVAVLHRLKESDKEKTPSIIVDMNTVTTISAINERGEYVGCCIFPGVQMSFDSMHGNTAQLPNVSFIAPKRVIGKNSQDSVRSGVIFGHAMTISGFVNRFAKEMKCRTEDMNLTITGEYSKYFVNVCGMDFTYDDELTLKGLYCIHLGNIK